MQGIKITTYRRNSSKNIYEINRKADFVRPFLSPNRKSAFSLLSVSKSDQNFYANFRQKANVLSRVLKEKASLERIIQSQIDTVEKIEKIKTQNEFYSINCDMRKEFAYKSIEKSPSAQTFLYVPGPRLRVQKRIKQKPPLSSYKFDANVIPECTRKPLTSEDLELYLRSHFRPFLP
jgi:hypothetical protein